MGQNADVHARGRGVRMRRCTYVHVELCMVMVGMGMGLCQCTPAYLARLHTQTHHTSQLYNVPCTLLLLYVHTYVPHSGLLCAFHSSKPAYVLRPLPCWLWSCSKASWQQQQLRRQGWVQPEAGAACRFMGRLSFRLQGASRGRGAGEHRGWGGAAWQHPPGPQPPAC